MKRTKVTVLTLWNTVCIIIVLGFLVFSMLIGGSASLGFEQNGQFFVGNHGEVVEVTETLYVISSIWEIIFWHFVLLSPIGGCLISRIQDKAE